jgi:hypothetical protein
MPADLVLIRTCKDVYEAFLLRSVLETEGIEVFIPDEHMATLHPAPPIHTGGVRLFVPREQAGRAIEVLDTARDSADEPERAG